MGIVYDISRSAVTLTAGNDIVTIAAAATRSFRIISFSISGLGNASAQNEFGFFRQSALGTTGGGALTPMPPRTSFHGADGEAIGRWRR